MDLSPLPVALDRADGERARRGGDKGFRVRGFSYFASAARFATIGPSSGLIASPTPGIATAF